VTKKIKDFLASHFKNNKQKMSEEKKQKVQAALIIEVLGKPPEHLVETLKDMVQKIKEEKGVEVISDKINQASELKEKPGFYTNFAEIEVEVESMPYLSLLIFKYMPAHIEVISPEHITITNKDWGDVLNEITRRLHGYDEIARVIQYENQIMKQKLQQLLPPKEGEAPKEKEDKKSTKKKEKKKK